MDSTLSPDSSVAAESVFDDPGLSTGATTPSGAPPPPIVSNELGDYLVWNPPKSSAPAPAALPDAFFEPTSEEIKSAWQSQSRLVDRLNNAPLKTQAIREREAKEKAARWPETRIRIKYPNQLQVEKKFSSTEKIRSVYAFVRSSLTDAAKPNKFVLYETPPRRELKVSDPEVKNQTLAQLGLAPSTVLHFSFLDENLNNYTAPPPLLPEILQQAADLPPPPSFDDQPSSSSQGAKGKGRAVTGGSNTTGGSGMPKWLKLGKK